MDDDGGTTISGNLFNQLARLGTSHGICQSMPGEGKSNCRNWNRKRHRNGITGALQLVEFAEGRQLAVGVADANLIQINQSEPWGHEPRLPRCARVQESRSVL